MTTVANTYDAIDLFAGPGGWDIAALGLGLDVLGIEWDDAAAATRLAAGLKTEHGDVRSYSFADFPATGLIASPPCPTFSAAGKGSGRRALDSVLAAARIMMLGDSLFTVKIADLVDDEDERTSLVLEPLRFVLEAHAADRPYRWLAFEQVPPVLPVWQAFADHLERLGYSVMTGVLSAEMFGVPQTRKRAILIARLDGEAKLPKPTHSRYYPRNPDKLDGGVLPWVSMAQALGWEAETVVRSNYGTGGDPANRGELRGYEPAATVTSKVDRFKVSMQTSGASCETCEPRSLDEPSRTILGKGQAAWYVNGNQANSAVRPSDTPAPTIHFGARMNAVTWVGERPSTSVNGDPRIAPPGRREFVKGGPSIYSSPDTVRVSVEEAAILQSFPPGYPWQGTKTQQYQQVGNAIPVQMAKAILKEAIGG